MTTTTTETAADRVESYLQMAESALYDARDETGHSINCVCPVCQQIDEATLGVSMALSEAETLGDEEGPQEDEDDEL